MAAACKICTHPDRHAIERAIIDGLSNRRIAAQYGLSATGVRRHESEHLARQIAEIVAAPPEPVHPAQYAAQKHRADVLHITDVTGRLAQLAGRLERVVAGCEETLRHPEDPDRVWIDPQGSPAADLLVKTSAELRAQQDLIVKVLDKIQAHQEQERFRAAVLDAIAEVDQHVRDRIIASLQRRRSLG